VGPRAGLDKCGKSRPPSGFDPRTVHPVASRYTDWDPLQPSGGKIIYEYSTLVKCMHLPHLDQTRTLHFAQIKVHPCTGIEALYRPCGP